MMSRNPTYPAAAIPYLMIRGAARALDFYKNAFGAKETMRFPMPDGKIGHAEIQVEGAPVFLADESPQSEMRSPQQLGGTTVTVCVYVKDVDAFARRAEAAGAKVVRPVADQFYGERNVGFQDPFGHLGPLLAPARETLRSWRGTSPGRLRWQRPGAPSW
jgi:PhnB protein